MRPLVVGGIGSPASGFEGTRVYEAIVDIEKTFPNTICDFVEIACTKLISDKPGGNVSLLTWI
jgi:hypothetical protein